MFGLLNAFMLGDRWLFILDFQKKGISVRNYSKITEKFDVKSKLPMFSPAEPLSVDCGFGFQIQKNKR